MPYHNKQSLGQNFIKFPRLVRELIEATDINLEDTIVEIGPGKGIITFELSKRSEKVLAVEKDEILYKELCEKLGNLANIKLFHEDFLDFGLPKTPYKIISNIPFSITSEIINKILQSQNLPKSMYLIMQKEAADKFVGKPIETQSSILTKPWYEVEILGEIDRTSFTQKPQVKIVFVKFVLRERPFVNEEDKTMFRKFVIFGFSRWAATVMEAYKDILTYDQSKNLKKMLKIGEVRPSQLSFDKWLQLFKSWRKIANTRQSDFLRSTI